MPSGMRNLVMGLMIHYFEHSMGLDYQIDPCFGPTFSAENQDARIAAI
jgi:hypothetical protein